MVKNYSPLLILFFFAAMQIHPSGELSTLSINAERTEETITIDGLLTEDVWQKPGYTHFVQQDPDNGENASLPSEVWLVYDDEAVYFGGRFYDDHPDSIVARLVRRDFIWGDPSDGCVLYFDPYHDKRSGYFFYVSAAGTLADGLLDNDVKQPNDLSWDAVWEGAANVDNRGWTAEMKIPYSQLRFKEEPVQLWGINVERFISRRVETDMVAHTPRNESGFASRFPDLTGIKGIKPSKGFELLPYMTAKAEYKASEAGDPFNSGQKYTPNFGVDLKAGLTSNLTLNATINPDFGQVEVDPAVVNLSDVESSFQEKRPFFTEGVTIYSFGNGGLSNNYYFNWSPPHLFYSRRIGRNPQGFLPPYEYADVPEGTRILGAAKLSGQIFGDWKTGTLHALTNREFARVHSDGSASDIEMEPLTYYGAFRTLKEFGEGHQGLGILSTYVNRFFKDESLQGAVNKSAVVAAADGWTFLDDERTYIISGWGGVSNVSGTTNRITSLQKNSGHYFQRPDASYLGVDTTLTSLAGYAGRMAFAKNKGRFTFNSAAGLVSPGFENNDLGFNSFSDLINYHLISTYRWLEPTTFYRYTAVSAAVFGNYDFGGNNTGQGYWVSGALSHSSYNTVNISLTYNPESFNNRRTRGGPLTLNPVSKSYNFNFNSDFRNDWVLNAGSSGRSGNALRSLSFWTYLDLKVTPTLTFSVGPQIYRSISSAQWIGAFADAEAGSTYGKRYVFAELDQKTISAEIRTDWIINPQLSFQVYLQPLIASGRYSNFKMLAQPRTYNYTTYGENGSTIKQETGASGEILYYLDADGDGPSRERVIGNPDFNYISLRGNAVLRWEYTAGSTLYLVWTQSREDYSSTGAFNFGDSAADMFSIAPENIFMLKLSYLL